MYLREHLFKGADPGQDHIQESKSYCYGAVRFDREVLELKAADVFFDVSKVRLMSCS